MTCARYRHRLADQRRRLADLAPDVLPDQHRDTVAATWALSIERADRSTSAGLARPVLEIVALLDPHGIPLAALTTKSTIAYCGTRLGMRIDDEDLDDTVQVLHRFALLTIDESTNTVRTHGLLQRAVRDAIEPARYAALVVAAADALLEMWPPVARDLHLIQLLHANSTALGGNAAGHLLDAAGAPRLAARRAQPR